MNNHHEIISLHGVSPPTLKYEGDFFSRKSFSWVDKFFGGNLWGVILYGGTNDQIHAKWGVEGIS